MTIVGSGVFQTRSPFWLRINGVWVHLEGVRPGVARTPVRPRSEFVSVGGRRHAQIAQRVSRDWALDFQQATAESVAALSVAAEGGEVWLHDSSAARANMLDPRDCFGHDTAAAVLDCGVPLRSVPDGFTVAHPVRDEYDYTLTVWTDAEDAEVIGSVGGAVAADALTAPAGTGARPLDVPLLATSDGDLDVTIIATSWAVSGLQLVEGTAPHAWMPGQRTPCRVSVADPEFTANLIRGADAGLARGDYSVTVLEVG